MLRAEVEELEPQRALLLLTAHIHHRSAEDGPISTAQEARQLRTEGEVTVAGHQALLLIAAHVGRVRQQHEAPAGEGIGHAEAPAGRARGVRRQLWEEVGTLGEVLTQGLWLLYHLYRSILIHHDRSASEHAGRSGEGRPYDAVHPPGEHLGQLDSPPAHAYGHAPAIAEPAVAPSSLPRCEGVVDEGATTSLSLTP